MARLVRPTTNSLREGSADTCKPSEKVEGRTFDFLETIEAHVRDLQVHQRVQATDLGNPITGQVQLHQRCMDDVVVDRYEELIAQTERLNIRLGKSFLAKVCIPEAG